MSFKRIKKSIGIILIISMLLVSCSPSQKIIDNKRKLEIYENLKTQNKQFKKILHNDYEIDGIDDVEI